MRRAASCVACTVRKCSSNFAKSSDSMLSLVRCFLLSTDPHIAGPPYALSTFALTLQRRTNVRSVGLQSEDA